MVMAMGMGGDTVMDLVNMDSSTSSCSPLPVMVIINININNKPWSKHRFIHTKSCPITVTVVISSSILHIFSTVHTRSIIQARPTSKRIPWVNLACGDATIIYELGSAWLTQNRHSVIYLS